MRIFTGRDQELELLAKRHLSARAEMLVLSGRRRVGKSALVKKFAEGKNALCFEGLEGLSSEDQLHYFKQRLQDQLHDPLLDSVQFMSWEAAFGYLTKLMPDKGEKTIIFFDEFQWMAAGQSKLVSLVKAYWDNDWKDKRVLIILCGSIASFMVKKVIKSKSLYGRITGEMTIRGLPPEDSAKMFRSKRGFDEILQYLLVFGGIPKYLELVDLNKSFAQNMNALCFSADGTLFGEFEKVFYSQFKRHQIYVKIVKMLSEKKLSLNELSQKMKMPSGGGLKRYLTELEQAEFIKSSVPFGERENSKFRKYRLVDEFMLFYFAFMAPNLRTIRDNPTAKIFELVTKKNWEVWCGFAFERFCLKNAGLIARVLGFADDILEIGPYFERDDVCFQIDMLYRRADKVITLCEIKYNRDPVGVDVIAEVERKARLFKLPRGFTLEKALICVAGASAALKNSGYFHHILPIQKIFTTMSQ